MNDAAMTALPTEPLAPPTDTIAADLRARCPRPLGVHQVAVLLETDGYNDRRAQAMGAADVMDLAGRVWLALQHHSPENGAASRSGVERCPVQPRLADPTRRAVRVHLRAMARGVWYSVPWLVAMVTLLVAGVSYWASVVATPTVSVAMTLALIASLVITAPFIQAFARRGSFYDGFAARAMVARIVTRTLESGLVVAALVAVGIWFARQDILRDGTPDTNRLAAVGTFAIAAFELGLAPLYLRRAFRLMLVIVAPGGAWLTVQLLRHGYLNPLRLAWEQVWLVAIMAALAWAASGVVLLGPERTGSPRVMWKPRETALLRAVAPYAAYGVASAGLIACSQLVAGGALFGRFAYDQDFALASGAALVVLVGALAQVTAATDRFVEFCRGRLERLPLSAAGRFRADVLSYWRLHLALTIAIGALTAVLTAAVVPQLGLLVLHGLDHEQALFRACLGGFVLLAVGLLDAQLLFCLSEPTPAVVSAWLGMAAAVVGPRLLLVLEPATSQPTLGAVALVGGCGVFAAGATVGTWRVLRRAELAWYRAL